MTITSVPPSLQAQAMLKALQTAVSNTLDKKERLGHYAVIWQDGQPQQKGTDAPSVSQPSQL